MSTNLMPWQRLSDLIDDRLNFGEGHAMAAPLDIVESETGYEVTLDLPGIASDQVELEYRENRLWISGERAAVAREEGKKYHRLERGVGKFKRVIGLPEDVDADRIEAKYEHGVLSVLVPKAETTRPKKITIQSN